MDLEVVETILAALGIAYTLACDDRRQPSVRKLRYLAECQKTRVPEQPDLIKHLLSTYQARWLAKKLKEGAGRFERLI